MTHAAGSVGEGYQIYKESLMAVHSKLSRVRFCHGKPKSIRRKESENIPNIINRTLSHVEIENFSSSLQYYRKYISKMGERKNSL